MDFITLTAAFALSGEWQCKSEFKKWAESGTFIEKEFREVVANKWNQKFYRSSSFRMGEGVELHFEAGKSPVVLKIQNQTIEKISFSKDCLLEKKEESLPWHLKKSFERKTNQPRFDDSALKQVVDSGKPSIIYSWSPKYAYSVYDLPRVKAISEKLGYQFIPVVDPRVSESEAKESLRKIFPGDVISRKLASLNELPVNVSYELYFRGGFNHFPFTYLVNKGKIHPRFIIGVMKEEGYRNMMTTFMKEL